MLSNAGETFTRLPGDVALKRVGIAKKLARHDQRLCFPLAAQFQPDQMIDLPVIVDARRALDHLCCPVGNPLAVYAAFSDLLIEDAAIGDQITIFTRQVLPLQVAACFAVDTIQIDQSQTIATDGFQALAFLRPFNRIQMSTRLHRFSDLPRRWTFPALIRGLTLHKLCNFLPCLLTWRGNGITWRLTISAGDNRTGFLLA